MKILMLAPQPFFEPRGTPLSVLGRLKALSQLGHEIDLLTYHVGQDVSIPKVVIHRTRHISFIKSVRIGPSLTKLFLDILLFLRAFRMLQQDRYDLLHSHEEASFFGVLLAKLFGIRHLYDMHSSLPQQLRNFQYTRFRPLIRLFEWLEDVAINSSDAIITICPALEKHVKENKRNGWVPEVMIENVASEAVPQTVLKERDVQTFRAVHSLDARKIVLYTGTFEYYQGIDLLIASAERVLRQRRDVIFLMVGGKSDQVRCYQKSVNARELSAHFRFTGTRPMDEIPQFIGLADILVSPRTSGTNTPLKIYSYLKSGKPIVATNIMAHTQVLNADIAILTEASPEALGDGILRVLEDEHLGNMIADRARTIAEQKFGEEGFVEKTRWILEQVGCRTSVER